MTKVNTGWWCLILPRAPRELLFLQLLLFLSRIGKLYDSTSSTLGEGSKSPQE